MQKIWQLFKNRWFKVGIRIVILALCSIYLVSNLTNVRQQLSTITIDIRQLLVAIVLTIICILLGSIFWWLLLLSLGHSSTWLAASHVHLSSNLAKYIPGYAWQILGKSYMSREMGVPGKTVGVGIGLEFGLTILVGLIISILLLPSDSISKFPFFSSNPWNLRLILSGLALAIITSFFVLPYLLKGVHLRRTGIDIKPIPFWSAILLVTVNWLLYGISFWFLSSAFQPQPISTIPLFSFTLIISIIIGLVVIFAPTGIGVRESVMVFFLVPYLSGPIAVLVATTSRVILLISELIGLAFIETIIRFKNSARTKISK